MPLFRCTKCGCADNTATAPSFWDDYLHGKPPLCSECDGGQRRWHGLFPKQDATAAAKADAPDAGWIIFGRKGHKHMKAAEVALLKFPKAPHASEAQG